MDKVKIIETINKDSYVTSSDGYIGHTDIAYNNRLQNLFITGGLIAGNYTIQTYQVSGNTDALLAGTSVSNVPAHTGPRDLIPVRLFYDQFGVLQSLDTTVVNFGQIAAVRFHSYYGVAAGYYCIKPGCFFTKQDRDVAPLTIVGSYAVTSFEPIYVGLCIACAILLLITTLSTCTYQFLSYRVCQDLTPKMHNYEQVRQDEEAYVATRKNKTDDGVLGLCFSGGGIRAASFMCGTLQSMDEQMWNQVDYLSSVSGGGYTATSFLTHYYQDKASHHEKVQKFAVHMRNNASYLFTSFRALISAVFSFLIGVLHNAFYAFAMSVVIGALINSLMPEFSNIDYTWFSFGFFGFSKIKSDVIQGKFTYSVFNPSMLPVYLCLLVVLIVGGVIIVVINALKQKIIIIGGREINLITFCPCLGRGYKRLSAKEEPTPQSRANEVMDVIYRYIIIICIKIPVVFFLILVLLEILKFFVWILALILFVNPFVYVILVNVYQSISVICLAAGAMVACITGQLTTIIQFVLAVVGVSFGVVPYFISCARVIVWDMFVNPLVGFNAYPYIVFASFTYMVLEGILHLVFDSSLHYFYKNQLIYSFYKNGKDILFTDVRQFDNVPVMICNGCVNNIHSPLVDYRGFGSFQFSQFYTGAPTTGYYKTEELRHVRLGKSMAISGAALAVNNGYFDSIISTLFSRLTFYLYGVNLGKWFSIEKNFVQLIIRWCFIIVINFCLFLPVLLCLISHVFPNYGVSDNVIILFILPTLVIIVSDIVLHNLPNVPNPLLWLAQVSKQSSVLTHSGSNCASNLVCDHGCQIQV